MYALLNADVGAAQILPYGGGVADTTQRNGMSSGEIVGAYDPWWGAGEFLYAKASGAIRQFGLCQFAPVFNATTKQWDIVALEVTNVTIMGRPVCVAMLALADTQFGWFCVSGLVPVNCNASVAADTTFSIAAAGQGGALAAGKQIVNARIAAAATTTVVKASVQGNSGDKFFTVVDSNGFIVGGYMSGTGVGAAAILTSISADGRTISVSVANSAAVTGNITCTYNNATIFYNVAHLNRPFAQGAIT
jgi:hypothetical protein